MRIYFDVCCLNRPFDDQTQQRIHLESEAVLSILERAELLRWHIIGGEVIEYEISNIPDPERRSKVENLSEVSHTFVKVDHSISDRASTLIDLGFKPMDALHIACAEKSKADIFLTTDDPILQKAEKNKSLIKIKVANPLSWIASL